MVTRINRLTDRTVKALKAKKLKGLHPDGNGLYLQIFTGGGGSWIFRYKFAGRARDMGLGSLPDVSLARAREKAAQARQQRAEGKDPIAERNAQRAQELLAKARSITFQDCAEQLIASHEAGWRNPKHKTQWRNTLSTYAYPILGDISVADVNTDLVKRVLQPIWVAKTATASRVRGRIEAVLSWAKANGLRLGENPAQWRGHLDHLLPARSKVRRVVHHAALPHRGLPVFMAKLRAREGIAPRALEFVILTAARTGEVLGAKFHEIDFEERLWTVPAERMKGGKEHRVPLSPRAVAIVKEMAANRLCDFVFPGARRGRPMSAMTLLMLLRDLHPGVTTHGFRSTFKDWASETTSFPDHLSEMALAHISADKVRAAYARSDLFQKRRDLMEAWANYCEPKWRLDRHLPLTRIPADMPTRMVLAHDAISKS
jgi:integrase